MPVQWNPAAGLEGVLHGAGRFIDIDFWTKTALPAAAGFVGTKIVGGFVTGLVAENVLKISSADAAYPWVRLGGDILSASALSWAVGRFVDKRMGQTVFLGGVVSIAHSVLKMLLGGTDIGRAIGLDGLSGLGEDLSAQMKRAVAQRVAAELSGANLSTYMTDVDLQRQLSGPTLNEFVTDVALRRQPAYGPTGDLRDHDVLRQETAL